MIDEFKTQSFTVKAMAHLYGRFPPKGSFSPHCKTNAAIRVWPRMKKELIILGAALALAGCNPQGGTGKDSDTTSGSASSSSSTTIVTNNGPSVSGTLKIDTNQPPKSQGSSSSQSGSSSKSSSQSSPQ
jgi:predicted small secreted protein